MRAHMHTFFYNSTMKIIFIVVVATFFDFCFAPPALLISKSTSSSDLITKPTPGLIMESDIVQFRAEKVTITPFKWLFNVTPLPLDSKLRMLIRKIDFVKLEELCKNSIGVRRANGLIGDILKNNQKPFSLIKSINQQVSPINIEMMLCSFVGKLGNPDNFIDGLEELLLDIIPFKTTNSK